MERMILTLGVTWLCFNLSLAQQHTFKEIQIKDITKDHESEWQSSQVQARIISLSHDRFEIELYDNPERKAPTLSYEVKYHGSDEKINVYRIMLLNGVQLVNPGPGDIIETSTPLEEMAKGNPGTVAINEDALKELVIYKME